ncbi:MAG TPA: 4-hydroxy-tetrahydrodipicolinate reductase [Anaerovoracaceae bacterium]|nr:4-hydroxy-tetrahydrodipicolinate reductase [Anaerovoracaceae bacterium]
MKIALVGYGKTGQMVKCVIDETQGAECAGIVSSRHSKDFSDISGKIDVVIDFSHPSKLEMIRKFAESNPVALVLGTTGYSPEHVGIIEGLSEKVPVVYTANFSLGITIFQQILKQITPVLRDAFDIEMIEKHHKMKLDAPSGTAKMLLKTLEEGKEYNKIYGREGIGKRGEEIGIHSVRGGTIAGEHTVLFAGDDEILEITHRADSNRIFASGAILAAQFAVRQAPGLYDMNEVLFHNM